MKLLLSSLQLASLCALSSWSASSEVVVSQSEDVTVVEGDTVEIRCSWTSKSERMWVSWMKNKTEINKMMFNRTSSSLLTLENITKDHSGTYICKVSAEIPFYASVEGNGTVITVESKENDQKNNEHADTNSLSTFIMLIGLAVVLLILLIAFIWVCCLRRRKAQAARVIYEVPHFDSETQEMDKHSTSSSRGSSQWCQVPVYESYSYFEHVEAKKSG